MLPARVRRIAACVLVGASALLLGVDGFTLVHYHNVLDAGLLEIVLATNPAEAWEYVTSQAGGIAAAVLLLAAGIALLGLGRRWLRKREPWRCSRQADTEARGASVPGGRFCRIWQRGRLLPQSIVVLSILLLAFAGSLVHAAADPDERFEDALRANSLLRLACNVRQAQEEIGSASRHHMQLYGYGLPTTPRLDQRSSAGELVVYPNITSPHAGTMAVLRTLFSFYDEVAERRADGMWYDYGDLFDILRAAGVYTAWLSNQEASGFYGSIGRTLGERTDHVAFTSPVAHSIDLAERYDGEVLPLLDEELRERAAESVPTAFYVIHLMGAHEEFSKRYPKEYAQFTAEDERGRGMAVDEKACAVRAAYDNAVLYDDAIVDQIIQRFEGEDALVIFISDHGEEVYDTRAQFGHGDETSPWQRDVPMVFWMSEAFRARHPDDAARIEAARERHWQSDEMIHTILDLLDIRTPEFDEKKSLLVTGGQAER